MNKEERFRALMIQLGQIPPEEEEGTQQKQNKKSVEKNSPQKIDFKRKTTSSKNKSLTNKKKQTAATKQASKKSVAKAPTVKNTGRHTLNKTLNKIPNKIPKSVSLSAHKKKQRRKARQQWDWSYAPFYVVGLLVLILVIMTIVKGCQDPGPMQDIDAEKTQEVQSSTLFVEDTTESTTAGESSTEEVPTESDSPTPSMPSTQNTQNTTEDSAVLNVGATVGNVSQVIDASAIVIPNWIQQDFIRVNEYSRPQIPIQKVEHIAIHWVANSGSSAKGNRDYFDNLGNPVDPAYATRMASAQFVVGLEGEIIQCMPLNEMAYAVRDVYNPKTISIEVCHPDESGKFSTVTYNSVVKLAAWLMQQFGLEGEGAILRHHDCDGKDCPKYYVENPSEWKQLQQDILNYKEWNPSIS